MLESISSLGLNPNLLERYLKLHGWESRQLKSDKKYLSIDDQEAATPIDFVLSFGGKSERRDLEFALETVAQYYEKNVREIAAEIRSLAFDTIMTRIPDEYVKNDSIELRMASDYIEKMKELLAATASTELSGERHFQRVRKEGLEFSERCRFGHTFRGSFGFQIESPVGLNNEPTLDGTELELPLGRKVVERLSRGLSSLGRAVHINDSMEVVREVNGMSSNMCDVIVDIIRDVGISRLNIGIAFSPEWRVESSIEHRDFIITHAHAEILEDVSRSLRVTEAPVEAKVFGRIKRLETSGNPSDLAEDRTKREIEVIWVSEDSKPISVKMALSPQDYLVAVEAHKGGRPIMAQGVLGKVGRGWRLDSIVSFRDLDG